MNIRAYATILRDCDPVVVTLIDRVEGLGDSSRRGTSPFSSGGPLGRRHDILLAPLWGEANVRQSMVHILDAAFHALLFPLSRWGAVKT